MCNKTSLNFMFYIDVKVKITSKNHIHVTISLERLLTFVIYSVKLEFLMKCYIDLH